MKKIIALSMAALLILMSWIPNKASAITIDEDNVTAMEANQTVKGNWTGGIEKTYSVHPPKIGTLKITIKCYIDDELNVTLSSKDNQNINVTKKAMFDKAKGYSLIEYQVYAGPRTYYLTLSHPIVVLEGAYQITTKFQEIKTSEKTADNISKDTAIQLNSDKFYLGVAAFDETGDYYSYTVKKGQHLKFKVLCDIEGALVSVKVLDSKDEVVDSSWASYKTPYALDKEVKPGVYTFVISKENQTDTTGFTYRIMTGNYKAINKITLSKDKSKTLYVGDSIKFKPTIQPEVATETYSYTSSDSKIVTVSKTGEIKAIKKGTATITVKTDNGMLKSSCKITVKEVAVSKITLNKKSATLFVGDTATLTATVSPKNATKKTVTWKSSNPKVAIVSSKGVITAKGKGKCTITCTAGGKSVTASITVNEKAKPTPKPTPKLTPKPTPEPTPKPTPEPVIPISKISISGSTTIKLTVGVTQLINVVITPSNATDKTLIWTSSNPSVVIVDNGKVKAIKSGDAIITINNKDGSAIARCTVIVD